MRHAARFGAAFFAFTLLIAQLSCGDSSGPGLVASSISPNSATTQSAAPGTAVADPPSVIVLDQHGAPLAGATVTFAVTSGGGSVAGGNATTSATGVATVGRWTLGAADGVNTLTASIGGLAPVTFTANGADPCVVSSTHAIGSTTNGELTVSDCAFSDGSFVDFYGTTLAGPGTYVFTQSSAVFDTFLILYTANGVPIGANDDLGIGFSDSKVKAILPAGDYAIAANSYNINTTGAYTISSLVGAEPVTNCEDVFVVRGTTTTQSLQPNDCANSGFYADDYLIFLIAGQGITVSMNSSTVDSYLALYDVQSGSPFAQNDNKDGTTKDAQIIFTPSFTGFYAISATSSGAGGTGEYTIIIQ
jgi:hypothetical protein